MSFDWNFIDNETRIPWTNKRTTSLKEQRINSCDSGYGSANVSPDVPEEIFMTVEESDLSTPPLNLSSRLFGENFDSFNDFNPMVATNTSEVGHIRTEIRTMPHSVLTRFIVSRRIREKRVP